MSVGDFTDILTTIIALLALIVSFFAFKRSTLAAMGQTEILLSERISQTKNQVIQITLQMAPFISKQELTEEEKRTLAIYKKSFNAYVEDNLNAYDEACSKYIDNKVDRKRFEKNYRISIRQLVENPDFKSYFDPLSSRYKRILKVYREWEDTEN